MDKNETLLKIFEKVKEQTGTDMSEHQDNIILIGPNGQRINLKEADSEELESLLDTLSNPETVVDQKSTYKFSAETIDGWEFEHDISADGVYMHAKLMDPDQPAVALTYDVFEQDIAYEIMDDNEIVSTITRTCSETSYEDILNTTNIIVKQVEILSKMYGYPVPSPDVCVEFAKHSFLGVNSTESAMEEYIACKNLEQE